MIELLFLVQARHDFFKILCFCKSPTQSEFCNYRQISIFEIGAEQIG